VWISGSSTTHSVEESCQHNAQHIVAISRFWCHLEMSWIIYCYFTNATVVVDKQRTRSNGRTAVQVGRSPLWGVDSYKLAQTMPQQCGWSSGHPRSIVVELQLTIDDCRLRKVVWRYIKAAYSIMTRRVDELRLSSPDSDPLGTSPIHSNHSP